MLSNIFSPKLFFLIFQLTTQKDENLGQNHQTNYNSDYKKGFPGNFEDYFKKPENPLKNIGLDEFYRER